MRILMASLLAVAAVLSFPAVAAAQQQQQQQPRCPTRSFLSYGGLVYASEAIPASVTLGQGAELGAGTVDQPIGNDPCRRERVDVTVVRLGDLGPGVAAAVSGRPGVAFVLGARCSGYEEDERWDCLLNPLSLGGVDYTGQRYPVAGAAPLETGEPLGDGQLAGDTVQVVALEGVDSSLAVGVEDRPGEAFVAPFVCPYERFDEKPALDDLRRCLTGPMWFTFDPPGARIGEPLVANGDRPLPAELAGASVALARLLIAGDVVPQTFSGGVPIGALRAGSDGRPVLRFDAPDVEPGLYEAVVVCDGCEGRQPFPAGSVLIGPERGGGSSLPRILAIVLGLLVLGFGIASVLIWRRRRSSRRPPSKPEPEAP